MDLRRYNVIRRGLRWYRAVSQATVAVHSLQARIQELEDGLLRLGDELSRLEAFALRASPDPVSRATLAAIPASTAPFPSDRPSRKGILVKYLGSRICPEQPGSMWFARAAGSPLLQERVDLLPDDVLTVSDDDLHDFAVGTLMVKAEHGALKREGFITLETLIAETTEVSGQLWVAGNAPGLRTLVESESSAGVLYSTNRLGPREIEETFSYLSRFSDRSVADADLARDVHPLQAGAHAHRLGVWALANTRDPEARATASRALENMMIRYAMQAAHTLGGRHAWPYNFDFSMPWGTKLKAPWYSGYANSAMAGAAACAFRLTGKEEYRDAALGAIAFLRWPLEDGGAAYTVDGYAHVAEYCYRSPPIPNYRVLDGEICSLVYLYNAALLLADPRVLSFCMDLQPGLLRLMDLLSRPDGQPLFGMDGQPMNPGYMWQLWVTLQLLANIFKERRFSQRARAWAAGIPQSDVENGFPV